MRKKLFCILLFSSSLLFTSCDSSKSKTEKNSSINDDKPLHPDVKTDYGDLPGGYKTMDEYYIDKNGNRQWHGYRKNLYPTLIPKMVSYYQYGELIWTETYDETGNVLTSNKK